MVGAAGKMVVGSQSATLFQSDRHPCPVLPTLAAGESAALQPPTQLLQIEKELHVLGLVGGVLALDLYEQISRCLQLQPSLGRWTTTPCWGGKRYTE